MNSSIDFLTKLKIGNFLQNYKVSVLLSDTPIGLNTNNPIFQWTELGGSINCPNNYFQLAFYDSDFNLILKTSPTIIFAQVLTTTEWDTIKAADTEIYVVVETYQNDTPVTGYYFSNYLNIDITPYI